MKPESVTVSKRGYIVLPASIRKEMNIKPGTKVLINKEKGKLTLETIPSFTQKLDGLTQQTIGATPEAVDAFIEDERKDRTNVDFKTLRESIHSKKVLIHIPERYQKRNGEKVKVIIISEKSSKQVDIIDSLLSNPIKIQNFSPLLRAEIHERF